MRNSGSLKVTLFGGFQMARMVDDQIRLISDQTSTSKKLWPFIQYLIAFRHKNSIPQAEIIETLWSDDNESNPTNALKTLLHRARNTMEYLNYPDGKQVILYRRGMYSWNNSLPIEVDTERFDELCERAETAEADKLSLLLQAVDLYQGDFLPKYSESAWVLNKRAHYHSQYLKICCEATALLETAGRYQDIIALCNKALAIAPYEEELHLHLIKALVAVGEQRTAIRHYAHTSNLLMDQLGVTPSAEFTAVYLDLIKTVQSVQLNLAIVREGLMEETPSQGPFYCEMAIFKEMYRREARLSQRSGSVVQLGLISILDGRSKKLTPKQVSITMNRLKSSIDEILRRGDAFTRFSPSQYLLLLPYATREGGEMVLRRVTSHFKRAHPKANVLLHCSVLPLLPLEIEQELLVGK